CQIMVHPILQYLSDALSLITIGMCLVLKVPQITKLLNSKSAVGISMTSILLELASYSIVLCYNILNGYAYLSYLEYPIILVQEYVLIYLVLRYSKHLNIGSLLAASLYFLICIGFLTQVIPKKTLTLLLPFCTPISASSKVAQLIAIFRAKNADSISPITWLISALSNV
ncbi:hypothetical protein QAD02_017369, partial [Eretmocerus hayati]